MHLSFVEKIDNQKNENHTDDTKKVPELESTTSFNTTRTKLTPRAPT